MAGSPDDFDVVCVASWNADLVSRVARPVARGETLMASDFSISPGGKGSNAAVAAARQGARVAVIARIGDDDFGRMGLALWQAEGIDAQGVEVAPGERSGVAQILVYDDGDNSIAVYRGAGAGAGLDARQIERACAPLQRCRVLMAPCEVPLAATEAAFSIARAAGAITLLNPAPAQPLPDSLIALCDLLTPNESELQSLAGGNGASLDEAARRLLAHGAGAVLVTLGDAGCRLYRAHQAPVALPGHAVLVRDTIGAGDCFTGTLAAALARGETMLDAIAWANAAAAISVTREGAVNGLPRRAEVAAWLRARQQHANGPTDPN
jgi:ribokinase